MKYRQMQGATLMEACVAFFIVMLMISGCLSTVQLTLTLQKQIAAKTWVLTQLESLADAVVQSTPNESVDLFTETQTVLQKRLPNSRLAYDYEPRQRHYRVNCVWTLYKTDHIHFIIALPDSL